jgi:mannose-6-phosphate isomerase-like protein (cupin superfamily)
MALITDGSGTVSMRGDEVDLSPQDCVFLPVGVDGTVTSTCDALRFIWGRARNQKSPLYGEARQQTMAPTAGILNPYLDVEPGVSYEEGNASRHWEAVCPETVGSCHCNLGLFQRPPGSGMRVRGHDPPTVSEAFTVLSGRLQITGPEGTEYVLEPGDFLFVPEYGKHANKNVGSSAVTYACLETPARSRTVSPAAPE